MAALNALSVAHFRTPYLALSETFIYSFLTHFSPGIKPVVFTQQIMNRDKFPFEPVVCYAFRKYSWEWVLNGVVNQFFGPHEFYLRSKFKDHSISLIHAHFGPEGWYLLGLKNKTNVPLVTTFYGYDVSAVPRQPLWRERYARLFEEGDLFLVEGPYMKSQLTALGCPESKIRLQPIAVDLQKIPYRRRAPKKGDKMIFLFCGRFTEKKGLIYALEAFDLLLKEGISNFEFRVIGGGDLEPDIRAYIEQNRLQSHVTLLGMRSHQEFYNELNRADVFVSPSVVSSTGDSEGGAPTTLLEAQAAGLPIITTYHADIPFVVREGQSALLSPERDAIHLKNHIRFLMEQPVTLAAFGEAGRRHIENQHNIQKEAKNLENIYLSLLNKRAAAGAL